MVYSLKDFNFVDFCRDSAKCASIMAFAAPKVESLWFLLPEGRKNSLTFGSHDGAEVSVIYHTFIETCKMCGVSTLEYFKEFFKAAIKREQFRMYSRNVERELAQVNLKAIMLGRTDYERSAMPLCLQRICYR